MDHRWRGDPEVADFFHSFTVFPMPTSILVGALLDLMQVVLAILVELLQRLVTIVRDLSLEAPQDVRLSALIKTLHEVQSKVCRACDVPPIPTPELLERSTLTRSVIDQARDDGHLLVDTSATTHRWDTLSLARWRRLTGN